MDGIVLLPRRTTHVDRHNDLPPLIDAPPREAPPKPVFTAPAPITASDTASTASFRTCQWLEGDVRDRNWCGVPVAWKGCSWCPDHEKIVWPNGRPRFRVH